MRILAKNKRAYFDYEVSETLDAGIVLSWHEVKSIKFWHVNINDAVVKISPRDIVVLNMDVPLYEKTSPASVSGYEPKGPRKLLLTKREQGKLRAQLQQWGFRLIPIQIYESDRKRIKLTIWLAKLKKKVEKRSSIKERETKREMDREIRKRK